MNVLSVEFIKLFASKANEICEREGKKTINTDHIQKAITECGFGEIREIVSPWFEEFMKAQARMPKLQPVASELSVEELRAE
jgi:hypothetical protein